jgi:hypothetical protein
VSEEPRISVEFPLEELIWLAVGGSVLARHGQDSPYSRALVRAFKGWCMEQPHMRRAARTLYDPTDTEEKR